MTMGRNKINIDNCINGCNIKASTKKLCSACYKRQYYALNKDKESKARREHNRANLNKIAARKRNREKEDINYKLANRLRHRLNTAIKGGGSMSYLGCSLEELKLHLEKQFKVGMSWNNWTKNGWHIDHIKPLHGFNLSDPIELAKACHYTNLRPLWWLDNLSRRYE